MLASHEFRAAAHHALFVERAAPALLEAEAVIEQAESVARGGSPHMSMEDRTSLGAKYVVAKVVAPQLRDILYPED